MTKTEFVVALNQTFTEVQTETEFFRFGSLIPNWYPDGCKEKKGARWPTPPIIMHSAEWPTQRGPQPILLKATGPITSPQRNCTSYVGKGSHSCDEGALGPTVI